MSKQFFNPDTVCSGDPPLNIPIMFLAGEWGCTPHWFFGHAWQSSLPGQPVQFFVTVYQGMPPMGAPPYLGKYILMEGSQLSLF